MGAFLNLSVLKTNGLSTSFQGKHKKIVTFAVFIGLLLIAVLLHFFVSTNNVPRKVVEEYIKCIEDKNYSKAIQYYHGIPYSPSLTDEDIITALKHKYEDISDISIIDIKRTNDSHLLDVNLRLSDTSPSLEENISLVSEKKSIILHKEDVKLVFPFKIQDIIINGINESEVYIDGKYAGKIQDSTLRVSGVIYGSHEFESKIEGICSSGKTNCNIDENNYSVNLPSILKEDFKENINKVITAFNDGWASYYVKQKPEFIKPYLIEELYNKYKQDNNRFKDSKYTNAKHYEDFLHYKILDSKNVLVTVKETWSLKEVITTPNMVFQDNNKNVLEQKQYITWNYNLYEDKAVWKIVSTEQTEFKKEIINGK